MREHRLGWLVPFGGGWCEQAVSETLEKLQQCQPIITASGWFAGNLHKRQECSVTVDSDSDEMGKIKFEMFTKFIKSGP